MLAELRDLHVWVRAPKEVPAATWTSRAERNFDITAVANRLKEPRQIGKAALVGRTEEGFAYAAIGTLQLDDATAKEIGAAVDGLLDAKGFILDLRGNSGGDERRALAIASKFADRRRVYAKHAIRCGPKPEDLTEPFERVLEPSTKTPFTKPVAVLIGPVCMSSAEGFAKMVKALPHAVLVGLPTRGASGNPRVLDLPNGVTVAYSTWMDMLPDGTVVEGRGIAPDVEVKHEGAGDPAFERAVEELRRRVNQHQPLDRRVHPR
jgi:C-terminal processing protease CtpA/Prc